MSEFKYPSNTVTIKDHIFIVFNINSLEEYLKMFADQYLPEIVEIISRNLPKNTRNLPYGYYYDTDGSLKIDIKEANEVRKIYDMYLENPSIRDIADKLDTNFSDIRNILHDNETYMQMQQKIMPISKLKQVNELLAQNIRGGAVKKVTTEDQIEEIRRKRKERERINKMNG